MSEIDKMYENVGIEPEYRYDCNLADTIKPIEVFPLRSCSKGEIKDYCTNKQDYRYCKVYKVNKIYPPFTAEKQLELIKWLAKLDGHFEISCTYNKEKFILYFYFNRQTADHHNPAYYYSSNSCDDFAELLATQINELWKDLKEEEKLEIMEILKG